MVSISTEYSSPGAPFFGRPIGSASGHEERTTNTLQADGKGYPQQHGYVVTARWLDARVLEAVVTKTGQPEGRVTYEVSPDRTILTLSAGEQLNVFDRSDVMELGRP